eukprot:GFKZ01006594.1.p1 GENE.GFKZ01006594.1~~GFKZ01006594.1.p1  ORF type:complete len:108 (-),score=5.10 GFKZ01006594.1:69-392(-)
MRAAAVDVYGQVVHGAQAVLHYFSRYIAVKRGASPSREYANLQAKVSAYLQMYTAMMINQRRFSQPNNSTYASGPEMSPHNISIKSSHFSLSGLQPAGRSVPDDGSQ